MQGRAARGVEPRPDHVAVVVHAERIVAFAPLRAGRDVDRLRDERARCVDQSELVSGGLLPADDVLLGTFARGLPAGDRRIGLVDARGAGEPDHGAWVVAADAAEA